jgi:hypothetical protein
VITSLMIRTTATTYDPLSYPAGVAVTIILSLIHAQYALQVSDRQLSEEKQPGQYEAWDRASNKSVILLGHDGLISMGYSGPAFISGATTDGWIAEVVAERTMGANRERPDFGIQLGEGVPDRAVYTHLSSVTDRLNEARNAGRVNRSLTISYVGLRWNNLNKPVWPVIGRITWDQARQRYAMVMSKRRWGWESGRSYLFAASGFSENEARAALRSRLPNTDLSSKEQAVSTLIDVLRSLPPQDTTVGKDCLVTTIQREPPHLHVKHEPYGISQVSITFRGGVIDLPASFSPWILTPTLLATPQVISGPGGTYQSGMFELMVEGSAGPGDFGLMSSQPRRRR